MRGQSRFHCDGRPDEQSGEYSRVFIIIGHGTLEDMRRTKANAMVRAISAPVRVQPRAGSLGGMDAGVVQESSARSGRAGRRLEESPRMGGESMEYRPTPRHFTSTFRKRC